VAPSAREAGKRRAQEALDTALQFSFYARLYALCWGEKEGTPKEAEAGNVAVLGSRLHASEGLLRVLDSRGVYRVNSDTRERRYFRLLRAHLMRVLAAADSLAAACRSPCQGEDGGQERKEKKKKKDKKKSKKRKEVGEGGAAPESAAAVAAVGANLERFLQLNHTLFDDEKDVAPVLPLHRVWHFAWAAFALHPVPVHRLAAALASTFCALRQFGSLAASLLDAARACSWPLLSARSAASSRLALIPLHELLQANGESNGEAGFDLAHAVRSIPPGQLAKVLRICSLLTSLFNTR
jgi:hypothetical protein